MRRCHRGRRSSSQARPLFLLEFRLISPTKGAIGLALKLQRSILVLPSWELELGLPIPPSRLPLHPRRRSVRCVLFFFPVCLPVPLFLSSGTLFFGVVAHPLARPLWAPTRGSKNRPGRPPWTEGPRELSRIEAFSACNLPSGLTPALCVLGLSRTGFAPQPSQDTPLPHLALECCGCSDRAGLGTLMAK